MAESLESFDSSIDLLDDCSEAYSNVIEGKADPTEALKCLAEKARLQREKELADKEKALDKEKKKRKKRRQKREKEEETDRSLRLMFDLLKAKDAEDDDVELAMLKSKLEGRKSELSAIEVVHKDQMALDALKAEGSRQLIELVAKNLAEARAQRKETREQMEKIREDLSFSSISSSLSFAELTSKIEEIQETMKASGNDSSSPGFWERLKELFRPAQ